eukprot:352597-Chlamydomonas_euryale.AAC.13
MEIPDAGTSSVGCASTNRLRYSSASFHSWCCSGRECRYLECFNATDVRRFGHEGRQQLGLGYTMGTAWKPRRFPHGPADGWTDGRTGRINGRTDPRSKSWARSFTHLRQSQLPFHLPQPRCQLSDTESRKAAGRRALRAGVGAGMGAGVGGGGKQAWSRHGSWQGSGRGSRGRAGMGAGMGAGAEAGVRAGMPGEREWRPA